MSKNILIINQYAGSPKHGMGFRSYYLAKELLRYQYDLTIISSSYSHLFFKLPHVKKTYTKEQLEGINFWWVKTPRYNGSKSLGRIWNMFIFFIKLFFFPTSKISRPDFIIISSLSIFPIINAYLLSKRFNAKLIFEVRDLWPQTLIEFSEGKPNRLLIRFIASFERFAYKKSDYVVSLLPNSKSYMIGKGLFEKKFRYIPNGIKTVSKNQVLDENIMKQLPKGKFIIGYTGTIGLANALDPLIESAIKVREHKKIHFIFVGNGSNKVELEKKVYVNNLENVTFIKAIEKDQISALIENFDVCYLGWHNKPIYKFGISANKLFDYMYAGKPILHAYSGTEDIVKTANAGINCKAYNVDEIVDTIYKFLKTSKNEMRKMGQNGKNYVLKYHTYEHLAKKYIKIFSDITDDMTIEGKGTNELVIKKKI